MIVFKAYKGLEPALYSMIPGWSPQVGVLAPFQKLDTKVSENLITNNSTNEENPVQNANNVQASPLKKHAFFSQNPIVTNLGTFISKNFDKFR